MFELVLIRKCHLHLYIGQVAIKQWNVFDSISEKNILLELKRICDLRYYGHTFSNLNSFYCEYRLNLAGGITHIFRVIDS